MNRAHLATLALVVALISSLVLGKRWHRGTALAVEAGSGTSVPMDPTAVGLHVVLGVGDEPGTAWKGKCSLSRGRIVRIDPWRPERNWKIEGNAFRTRTRQLRGEAVPPELFLTVAAPADATLELETNQGNAQFRLEETSATHPVGLLNGRATVRRTPASTRITDDETDDDYPASAVAPDGSLWLAYVAYTHGTPLDLEAIARHEFDSMVTKNNGDRVLLRQYRDGQWSAPLEATDGLSDVWRPAVAVGNDGNVSVAWSENADGNWDIYRRTWDPQAGRWSARERITSAPGADLNVVGTRDSNGVLWWAWQGWRGDNFNILLTHSGSDEEQVVADSPANEWDPAIAADSSGGVYVGWDSYEAGNYDVFVRRFGRDPGAATPVAASDRYEARVSLACDGSNRLWIAYEEDDANWGKDYSSLTPERVPIKNLGIPLYLNRTVRVKCLTRDGLRVTPDDLERVLNSESPRPKSFPRLAIGPGGEVCLCYRHHALDTGQGELWASYTTSFDGTGWSAPQFVPGSDYVMDDRPALAALQGIGVVAVLSSDARVRGGGPDLAATRFHPAEGDQDNDLYAVVVPSRLAHASGYEDRTVTRSVGKGRPGEPRLLADVPIANAVPPVHPGEADDIARMRDYRVQAGGKTYRLLRGEFHRHTEYTSHRDQDGGLEELWRYALDAAAMDWIGVGDHDNGWGREYPWWTMQKMASFYNQPPRFVAPFTYERSNVYPNGHRNVILARRGIRTLPRGELLGTPEAGTPDTKDLYAYLHYFGGICASHTSGTRMGTDWRDNDPVVEPVVELYQGHRHNYESFGAPRSPTEPTQIGGYEPAGFVWNALAKGYRLGFESSSDHVSTHMSYAVVLAEDVSRQGLVDAFRQRHSYAATDNILLDVRSGDHVMGDEFPLPAAKGGVRLEIKAIGTRPLARVHVIKNNGYVYTATPAGRQAKFTWQETRQPPGTTSYYYVRVEQQDGQLAWSSPMWVRYE